MSSKNVPSEVVSVDEQAFEKSDEAAVDEDGFEVVDETPEFQATVQMEVQAKVDANHPDGMVDTSEERIYGATLEQEERIRAREAELERISAKAEMGRKKVGKSVRETSQRSGALSGVQSSRSGRRAWTRGRTQSGTTLVQNSGRSSWRR